MNTLEIIILIYLIIAFFTGIFAWKKSEHIIFETDRLLFSIICGLLWWGTLFELLFGNFKWKK